MKTLTAIGIALITLCMTSCKKITKCGECTTPPDELNFKITDYTTGSDLIFNNTCKLDSIEIFYYENDKKTTLDFVTILDSINSTAIFTCYDVCWKSPQGFKDFYLYLGNNDIDTIFLDIEERHSECCTYYEWKDFTINGVPVAKDTIHSVYDYKKIVSY